MKNTILSISEIRSYDDSKLSEGGLSLSAARFLFEGSIAPEGKKMIIPNKYVDDLAIKYTVCKLITKNELI